MGPIGAIFLLIFFWVRLPSAGAQELAMDLKGPESRPISSPQTTQSGNETDLLVQGEIQNIQAQLNELVPDQSGTLALSFNQAIQLAILNNLKTLTAEEQVREAQGTFLRSLSGLLPNLNGQAVQTRRTSNLVSTGLDPSVFPGITPGAFGPFSNFDARIYLVQNIFDLAAIGEMQAGKSGLRLAKIRVTLAKQLVFQAAGTAYINAQTALENVQAAEADYVLAKTLYELTKVGFDAGVVSGVDKARAESKMLEMETKLFQAQTKVEETQNQLRGVLLVPMTTALNLTSPLRSTGPHPPSAETAVQLAQKQRPEILESQEEIRKAKYEHRTALGQQLPSLGFAANYGASGTSPTENVAGTYQLAGMVQIPIFDGGNTAGQIAVAKSKQRQAELQLGNLKQQTDKDVRDALANLKFASKQIVSSSKNVQVTKLELQLARERFFTGVGDNLEVVQAQASLANAQDAYVQALGKYNTARVKLAVAMGTTETFQF